MAPGNLHDPASKETVDTVSDMIICSDELAANATMLRDLWWDRSRPIALLLEGFRIQFKAFADDAASGKVTDRLALSTISRIYEEIAIAVGELVDEPAPIPARNIISKIAGLASLVASLVECGARPVILDGIVIRGSRSNGPN